MKVIILAKIDFVERRRDFRTPFEVIMIYTKQRTPWVVDNFQMGVIGFIQHVG